MRIDAEKELGTEPSGTLTTWFGFLAVMLASAVLLLIGAQLAFLVKLPHLPVLIRAPQAMWLVFTTWPEMRFGLFCFFLIPAYQVLSNISRKGLKPADAFRSIRGMSRPVIVAAIGISIFLLLFVLAAPSVFLELTALLFCAFLGCLLFIRASGPAYLFRYFG